jgi:hypothetical protein
MKHFFPLLFSAALVLPSGDMETIGQKIYLNECGGKQEKLVWWNEGEHFASLGIGHFIWYPKGAQKPYEETFPSLVAFLQAEGTPVPSWVTGACPWNNKQEFSRQEEKKKELQTLLLRTFSLQAAFIEQRFEKAREEILACMEEKKRTAALCALALLEKSTQGKFALIDYLNFKGAGTSETERYQGKGWGLKQVLEEMPDPTLQAFVETAKSLLRTRANNAPNKSQEERWLPGWFSRVDGYLKS